jgi:FtsZ-binding cell division protein ZapB
MSEYRIRCFDTIVLTIEENERLKADIARLQERLQEAQDKRAALDIEKAAMAEQRNRLNQEKRGA